MTQFSAIAMIEFDSIAAGTFAADAMAKEATLDRLRCGTVQPGKYLVLIGGSTCDVEMAYRVGMREGGPRILDDVVLLNAHPQVLNAIEGKRRDDAYDSLGTLETSTVAAILHVCDAVVKSSLVHLKEIRLGDGLGGRGIATVTGEREDVEAAMEIAVLALAGRSVTLCQSIVSRIDTMLADQVGRSTEFA